MVAAFLVGRQARLHCVRSWHRQLSTGGDKPGPEIIQGGELVLIESFKRGVRNKSLTPPLRHGSTDIGKANIGVINHSDIIGKHIGESIVPGKSIFSARVHRPSLFDYILLTPREVTPIYPADANVVVSLLDLHTPHRSENGPLEILEAGTGHGSLTFFLSRAIQGANSSPPSPPANSAHLSAQDFKYVEGPKGFCWRNRAEAVSRGKSEAPTLPDSAKKGLEEYFEQLQEWKSSRRAIVHTIDRRQDCSALASRHIFNFRRALYYPSIDFHVGDVGKFIDSRLQARPDTSQIFDHVLLDLPDVHMQLEKAARALKDNGSLTVFVPSITQIAQCVQIVRRLKLPLVYDQVLELGPGYSGGRLWDVRAVKLQKAVAPDASPSEGSADVPSADIGSEMKKSGEAGGVKPSVLRRLQHMLLTWTSAGGTSTRVEKVNEIWETVARPSVGHRVVGGGFVAVWRKRTEDSTAKAD